MDQVQKELRGFINGWLDSNDLKASEVVTHLRRAIAHYGPSIASGDAKNVDPSDNIRLGAHPSVEEASRIFWDACRTDLGRAVASMQEPWREPMEEFEKVRAAIRKGMQAALEAVN